MNGRERILVAALTISLAGFSTWKASEGFTEEAVIPTKGDVPTIGHGSTRWEDGTPVKLGDKITHERADVLARVLLTEDEKRLAASLPGVKLHLEEFEVYVDFIGQYGIGNWRSSTARRMLLAGEYVGACRALLKFRYAAKYDCSTLVGGKPNTRCWGVWTRQLQRHDKCMGVQ
jgi:lysozyme